MTWNELKEFCNNLPEKFLDKNVVMWREDNAINKIKTSILEEDHYIEDEDEYCFPEEVALGLVKFDIDKYPNGMDHFKKVYDKGHPILWEEFDDNGNG